MMMVDTEVRASPIHGLGVFFRTPIAKGTLIWRFDARVDRVYSEAEIDGLPPHMAEYLRIYSTWHEPTGLFVLCGDNGRYVNHSDAPNTLSASPAFGDDHALDDLPAGAEMTSNYHLICDRVRIEGMAFPPARNAGGPAAPFARPAAMAHINGAAHRDPR